MRGDDADFSELPCTLVTIVEQTRCLATIRCAVIAFKARLDKFWQHQFAKFDFTADLTGTGNRSEEVIK